MRMAWFLVIVIAVGVALALAPQPASAQQTEYPNVANLQPFSAQANYMSLPGYLRWVTWRDQQVWLSYPEASRIVLAQGGQVGWSSPRMAQAPAQ
jgi:hypothetical protein